MTVLAILGSILYLLDWLFIVLLLARFIIDWAQFLARDWRPKGIVLVLVEVVYTITDPPVRLFRRIIPTLSIGRVQLDLSILVLFIVAQLLLGPLAAMSSL